LFVVVVVLLTSIVRDCVSVTVIAGSVSSLPFRFRIFHSQQQQQGSSSGSSAKSPLFCVGAVGGRNKAREALLVVSLVLFFVVFLCRLFVCFLPDLLGSWHACLLCFCFLSAAPILSRLLFLGAPFPCALLSSSAIFVESSGDDDLCEEEEDCEEVEQMFAGVYRSSTLAFQMHAAVL
jgi:hypothetical protein